MISTENTSQEQYREQVISRERVADHGEVYTAQREVNAMLDLVKQETERIESRFLEPACGTGNFMAEVLHRKLQVVENRYKKSQIEFERYAVLAVSSIYGIDILQDNVIKCRKRLFDIFNDKYSLTYKNQCKDECRRSVEYIFEKNITWGDALTLHRVDYKAQPIVFPEWSPVNSSMLKRRDFTFHGLLEQEHYKTMPLFSDKGEDVCIPVPIKEYPITHFLRIADAD